MNPKVDFYFNNAQKWQEELEKLRTIVLECGLTEELKWGCPCYMVQRSNIVVIHAFKDYCALLFFKGAQIQDTHGILIQQTKNVQMGRQIRFTTLREIVEMESTLKAYIFEALEVEKSGLKLDLKEKTGLILPEEFQNQLNSNQILKTAFEKLTPGRQRAYNLFFSAPKQSKTRVSRIEKSIPQILSGKGIK